MDTMKCPECGGNLTVERRGTVVNPPAQQKDWASLTPRQCKPMERPCCFAACDHCEFVEVK